MNAYQKVEQVKALLDGTRIAKGTRTDIDYQLRSLSSDTPVSVDRIASPLVDAEAYWADRDRSTARVEAPAYTKVRAVNIDHMTEYDMESGRTPSAWSPRVELKVTVEDHVLVGDLSKDRAIELATELLAAAQLLS
jgi:hypothetical protein